MREILRVGYWLIEIMLVLAFVILPRLLFIYLLDNNEVIPFFWSPRCTGEASSEGSLKPGL